jgi:hypothetical protein
VGARRPDEKAAAGEGNRVGEGQRRAGGVVDAPLAVTCMRHWGKKMSLFFFFEKPRRTESGAKEACWAGPRMSCLDGTRLDEHLSAIIKKIFYF